MIHPIIGLNNSKLEETFVHVDELGLDELADELRRFADRAAPRVAYQFAANCISNCKCG